MESNKEQDNKENEGANWKPGQRKESKITLHSTGLKQNRQQITEEMRNKTLLSIESKKKRRMSEQRTDITTKSKTESWEEKKKQQMQSVEERTRTGKRTEKTP